MCPGIPPFNHDFGLTQEEISSRVGKKRSTIANTLRLLNLPIEIRDSLDKEAISEGHARALLSITDQKYQLQIWDKVVKQGLSVRQTERLARNPDVLRSSMTSPHVSRATTRHGQHDPNMVDVEDKLRRFLGTKVSILRHCDKGKIEIEFYDEDDLVRILDLIGQG